MLSVYAQSTQFIEVPISNTEGINPTSDVVKFAFLGPYQNVSQANEAVPTASTTYYAGAWQSVTANSAGAYVATCLVGPGAGVVALTTGTYLVIVKVTDSPEIPVLFSGPLVVN
jgi:hypothetical protein